MAAPSVVHTHVTSPGVASLKEVSAGGALPYPLRDFVEFGGPVRAHARAPRRPQGDLPSAGKSVTTPHQEIRQIDLPVFREVPGSGASTA